MLDLAKEKISEKIDENKAKAEISRYLESQHFEIPLFENEIDADGLKQFICGSGTALLKNRCFSGKAAERGQAHISFIEGAVNAAKPSNKESERKIDDYLCKSESLLCTPEMNTTL